MVKAFTYPPLGFSTGIQPCWEYETKDQGEREGRGRWVIRLTAGLFCPLLALLKAPSSKMARSQQHLRAEPAKLLSLNSSNEVSTTIKTCQVKHHLPAPAAAEHQTELCLWPSVSAMVSKPGRSENFRSLHGLRTSEEYHVVAYKSTGGRQL